MDPTIQEWSRLQATSFASNLTEIKMSVNDHRTKPTVDLFEVKQGPSASSCTFIFGNEDHTLGNALRHVLMQQKDTEFCGYSVPHPYEPKMNVRLQTYGNVPSVQVLKRGLKDLEDASDLLKDTFVDALNDFKNGM